MYDLPGTYSLISHSKEEEVTRDFICNEEYDAITIVCDAVCLERNLNLALQVLAICKNVIICVNLMDEAEKKKIRIDLDGIAKELNVPVIGIVARDKKGLPNLLKTIEAVSNIKNRKNPDELCISIGDDKIANFVIKAEEICKKYIVFEKEDYNKKDRKIDKVLTSKLTGIPIMILLLILIFWITISAANYPSSLLFDFFTRLGLKVTDLLVYIHLPEVLIEALINGIYKVLTWVISVMLPPMAIFFPLFTILEDLGYNVYSLARIKSLKDGKIEFL